MSYPDDIKAPLVEGPVKDKLLRAKKPARQKNANIIIKTQKRTRIDDGDTIPPTIQVNEPVLTTKKRKPMSDEQKVKLKEARDRKKRQKLETKTAIASVQTLLPTDNIIGIHEGPPAPAKVVADPPKVTPSEREGVGYDIAIKRNNLIGALDLRMLADFSAVEGDNDVVETEHSAAQTGDFFRPTETPFNHNASDLYKYARELNEMPRYIERHEGIPEVEMGKYESLMNFQDQTTYIGQVDNHPQKMNPGPQISGYTRNPARGPPSFIRAFNGQIIKANEPIEHFV